MLDGEGRREDEAGRWGGTVHEMDSAGLPDPELGLKGRIEGLLP